MARILLTGARGMLGQRLHEALAEDHEVHATSRQGEGATAALDLEDPSAITHLVRAWRPDWIVNAAAYTAVDRAESEVELAFSVNALAPRRLAEAAAEVGARLLHYSTDFVFSGEKSGPYVETDPVGPVGVYARSKEEGEAAVREALPDRHAIVRVAWLFGPGGKNFVATMLRLAAEKERLRVVDDQTGTPTFTRDAVQIARVLIAREVFGTIHSANSGATTWCRFAAEALRLAGLKTPIDPIATADYWTPAERPKNSALKNAVLESEGLSMRPWGEALADYIREIRT